MLGLHSDQVFSQEKRNNFLSLEKGFSSYLDLRFKDLRIKANIQDLNNKKALSILLDCLAYYAHLSINVNIVIQEVGRSQPKLIKFFVFFLSFF